jgi:hypothetical protein
MSIHPHTHSWTWRVNLHDVCPNTADACSDISDPDPQAQVSSSPIDYATALMLER